MTKDDAETIIKCIRSLVDDGKAREVVAQSPDGAKLVKPSAPPMVPRGNDVDLEKLYDAFKARLIDECRVDPILLQLLTQRPEIVVDVEPRVVTLDGSSLKGRIARQIAAGFFDTPKTQGACRTELRRTGSDVNSGNLSTAFNDFVKDGYLTREGDAYVKAAGLKITQKELVAT
jgi:hypothetical protein